MYNILITGANRGIGLELVRQYAARDDTRVFAASRNGSSALSALKAQFPANVVEISLDVTDSDQIRQAAKEVTKHTDRLEVLINNAAVNPPSHEQSLLGSTRERLLQIFNVNTVAPLLIAQAFLGHLQQAPSARLINLSSEMGSLSDKTYGGDYGYCASKAALNMITRGLAADLRSVGVIALALDPGWVQTDMGGSSASLTPAQSVSGILRVIDGLTLKDTGRYLRWNGSELHW
ncbi:MAG: SDR family oxidoreductase [Anaerolineae bacterium]|jgi:NAD(P)-dependent dehydrogenase (short-subunit alcohol dehydrogenase family)|nr:SDR family oxidoreductase [Anaerolineae bacterium]